MCLCSCIDCIITEQVEKLKVTLHEIKYLTSAAHDTASLIENMMEQVSHVTALLEYHSFCHRINCLRITALLMVVTLILVLFRLGKRILQQMIKQLLPVKS